MTYRAPTRTLGGTEYPSGAYFSDLSGREPTAVQSEHDATSAEAKVPPLQRYTAASLEAPGRLFQAFQVARTHNQLWLRADGNPIGGRPHMLEVHFDSVQYFCGPFAFRGLSLRRATAEQQARLVDAHGLEIDPQLGLFMLSAEHDFFVVSGPPQWAEADLPHNAPSVFYSSPTSAISIGLLQ